MIGRLARTTVELRHAIGPQLEGSRVLARISGTQLDPTQTIAGSKLLLRRRHAGLSHGTLRAYHERHDFALRLHR